MKHALISVSNKQGIVSLAREIAKSGYSILSTGGTASHLKENGIAVTLIEEVTGFPEMLDGRVKTLHPKIFGGILADTGKQEHLKQLEDQSIPQIGIVVVNLYPFLELVSQGEKDLIKMIENIDIGGVTLLRAAAKNYQSVAVVSNVSDYDAIIQELNESGQISLETRKELACKAFALTSVYDRSIHQFLSNDEQESDNQLSLFPDWEKEELRYGENPHQAGVFLKPRGEGLINLLWGKQLSYNNYLDINSALKLIYKFEQATVAILKHTNPCGVASADNLNEAYDGSLATDTLSPFGGIVVVNRALDLETAKKINLVFTEIIIAPDYEEGVLKYLKKKKERRLLQYSESQLELLAEATTYQTCIDGVLSQSSDMKIEESGNWQVVTDRKPSTEEQKALSFAWRVVAALKSNAICLSMGEQTIGLGMGQTSRIDSVDFAIFRAKKFGHSLNGAVCASDGFFPFRDGVEQIAKEGIKAIIQPGGSKGDQDVIKACNELGIAMIFTGHRHFSH